MVQAFGLRLAPLGSWGSAWPRAGVFVMVALASPASSPFFAERTLASTRLGRLLCVAAGFLFLSDVWTIVGNDRHMISTAFAALAVLPSGESGTRRRRKTRVPLEVEAHAMDVERSRTLGEHGLDRLVERGSREARLIPPSGTSPPSQGYAEPIRCSASAPTPVSNDLLACSTPKASTLEPTSAAGSMATPIGTALAPRRTMHILLVEDNDINQRLAFALLDLRGHTVDVVEDGAKAVAAAAARSYDIVLMDVRMPEMDGLAATRLIRGAGGPSSTVPIIAMTADIYPEQIEACRLAGMDDHISKPLRRAQLYATLERWLVRDPTPIAAATRRVRAAFDDGRSQAFDTEAYDRLLAYIGREKLDDILSRFAASLPARFGSGDGGPEALRLWAVDAHVVLSAAGMTGFDRLAVACRSLQSAAPRSELYRSSLEAARRARDEALLVLIDLRRSLAAAAQ